MKKLTRVMAAGLTLAMIVPMAAGCSKSNGSADVISSDDPWFNLSKIPMSNDSDKTTYESCYTSYLGSSNDGFVYMFTGTRPIPADFDYDTDSILDLQDTELRLYDDEGVLLSSMSYDEVTAGLPGVEFSYIDNIHKNGDTFIADVKVFDAEYNPEYYNIEIDIANGQVGEITAAEPTEYSQRLEQENASQESSYHSNGYTIERFWANTGSISTYVFEVIDQDGNVTEFDMRSLFPDVELYNIRGVFDIGNNRSLIIGAGTAMYSDELFVLDYNTMTLTHDTEDNSWLTGSHFSVEEVDGLGSILQNQDGIFTINYDDKVIEPVFLYKYSNINAFEVNYLTPVKVTEDQVIMTGATYTPNYNHGAQVCEPIMFRFDRADSNPNAGKTIINVASEDSYSYPLCEGVCQFNQTSSDYFVILNSDYIGDEESGDEVTNESNATSLGNQLAIDIMSGTGPDMIVNGTSFGMLNDDDYLLDLTSFVNENYTSDNYFTNVFEAAGNNGKLYQLPLAFSISGIAVDSQYKQAGQVGYTFEQYKELVDGPCNGTCPLAMDKMSFFIISLDSMTDLFINDGTVDLDNDAFRALAEYTKNNVNDIIDIECEDNYVDSTPTLPATATNISHIVEYFTELEGHSELLGIPSYDGRGPMFVCSDTIAISAQSDCTDGCRAFIDTLMGSDIQHAYGISCGICTNREAFDTACEECVNTRKAQIDAQIAHSSAEALRAEGMNLDPITQDDIDAFNAMIDNVRGMYTNDAAINVILREEMPAYFEGQKTLEQIIPVMEDRIQTVLNERV